MGKYEERKRKRKKMKALMSCLLANNRILLDKHEIITLKTTYMGYMGSVW